MIGGLLGGLVRRNEETGLNPLQNIAASMDALVMPKYRMGEQIRQQGLQRVAADRRNATIAELQKRADAGDTIAQRYLQGIQSGALDMKTGFAGYLNEVAANERFQKQLNAQAARANASARSNKFVVVGKQIVNRETGEVIYNAPDTPSIRRFNPATGEYETITGIDPSQLDLKESEVSSTMYGGRMLQAQQVLDDVESEGTDLYQHIVKGIPLASNYLTSPQFKMYEQAQRNFINAVLRRESGAAIAESEFANARIQYFPQPNDPPEVIELKRKNRELAIELMLSGAGAGGQYAKDKAAEIGVPDVPKTGGGSTVIKTF